MPTLGAHWSGQCATFNQGIDGLYVPDFLQTFRQKRSLVWRQFLKFFRKAWNSSVLIIAPISLILWKHLGTI